MSDAQQAFRQRLLAIFADEAREHLQRIDAGLLAIEQGAAGARAALVPPVLKTLHTLKGAARAVDLDPLERLCHALEGVLVAAGVSGATLVRADFDRLYQAAALARSLTGVPGGRVRNQAAALCGQLDRLAAELAARAAAGNNAATAAADPVPAAVTPAFEPPGDLVRVAAGQLDAIRAEAESLLATELRLRHHVGELQALAAALGTARRAGQAAAAPPGSAGYDVQCQRLAQAMHAACGALGATRGRLMGAILETALVPFSAALDELPALVRNLERSSGRQVVLELGGDSIQLDRRLLGVIREALIHLVSNAVGHGIEPAAARRAAGKSAAGTVRVEAIQRGGRQLLVRVADDGAGIDADALGRAALRQADADPAALARLGRAGQLALALRAGVSTCEQVSEVSGRGMGLAIVAEKVAGAGGELTIDSVPGRGSTFALLLPLGVASVRALVVAAGGLRYALPLDALDAVRALVPGEAGTVARRLTLTDGGRLLPLVRLSVLFGGAAADPGMPGVALIARSGEHDFALQVDAIVAEQDVLPKRLGPLLRRVRWFSGAAQLGDGSLVPVLALDDIARHALAAEQAGAALPPASAAAATRVLVAEDSITSRLLLKHILEGAGCAVETAADGLEALSKLRLGRFDAVVSDVDMPHLDGVELTAAIRANPASAALPVILVTSRQSPAERERGLLAGADAYLAKGAFDQAQLLAALRRLA